MIDIQVRKEVSAWGSICVEIGAVRRGQGYRGSYWSLVTRHTRGRAAVEKQQSVCPQWSATKRKEGAMVVVYVVATIQVASIGMG